MSAKHRHATTAHPAPPPVQETPPANLLIPPQPVVPVDDAVRTRAYQLWEAAGRPEDEGMRFWYEAEKELSGR